MKNWNSCLVSSISALFLGAMAGLPPPPSVPLRGQLASQWCWAASSQMAMEALGSMSKDVAQATQAGRAYPPVADCFSTACGGRGGITAPTCNFGGFPQFYKFGYDVEVTSNRALDWPTLSQELLCRPVVFATEDLINGGRAGTGHMMVATSAAVVDNAPWIAINDPAPACIGSKRCMSYQDYVGGTTTAHWVDYYGMRKAGMPLMPCPSTTFEERRPSAGRSAARPEQAEERAFTIREGIAADVVVQRFIKAVQGNEWMRKAAGLEHTSNLNCDSHQVVNEATISISDLRDSAPSRSLDSLVVDSGRQRFLCQSEPESQTFSVEVERSSGIWRVATMGDVGLASELRKVYLSKTAGQEVEEVLVRGLNVRFARRIGNPPRLATPLLWLPIDGRAPESQPEDEIFKYLRKAAATFRAYGPS